MKALEKAAQDRAQDQDGTPATQSGTGAPRELTLEAVDRKSAGTPEETVSRAAATPSRASGTLPATSSTPLASRGPLATPAAPASTFGSKPPVGNAAAATSGAQARAATVVNASAVPSEAASTNNIAARVMARPLYLIGGVAALFLLSYGGYVYLQIAHPSLLIKAPPRTQSAASTPAPAPIPASNQPLANGAPQAADNTSANFVTLQSVFGNRTDAANPATPSVAPRTAPTPESGNVRDGASNSGGTQAARAPAAPSGTVSAALATPSPAARVAISRGDTAAPRVNPVVSEAYAALEARQFETAQRLYSQVLRSEPGNIDALLGLAAIAQYENRMEDAQRHFMAILDVEPRHTLAQSGLVALMGRADPQAAETRLKQLLAREPSSTLYFNLGNLYAEQGQWPQAQQAYFQAHTLGPRNPDYAYNLAVGLEHLGQPKLALDFYRKALQLAADKGNANFDAARIQARVNQLAARAN